MSRKLILTPYEHGGLAYIDILFNKILHATNDESVDTAHLFLSAVTMAGVGSIQSFSQLPNSQTTLVKKILSKSSIKEWINCNNKVETVFKKYITNNSSNESKQEISNVSHRIKSMFYAMKTNSGILLLAGKDTFINKHLLPPEIIYPIEILFDSIQTKNATLPIVKHDMEKGDIKRLLDVLGSKQFKNYQEAQSEIEVNSNLTTKTIKTIEKAGKDLYKKNVALLNLQENIVRAIPLSAKVIDLVFGKIPGILTEYTGTILTDYLKLNKTIPLYSCDKIINNFFKSKGVLIIKNGEYVPLVI